MLADRKVSRLEGHKVNAGMVGEARVCMEAFVRRVYNVARAGLASVLMRLADREYGELAPLSAGRFPRDRASDPQAN
jgi:hypothetical protein